MLRAPVDTRGEDMTTVADFEVRAGETIPFVLTYGPSHLPVPEPIDPATALQESEDFWTGWCSSCSYKGEYRNLVLRSLMTLKALTFAPTGGSWPRQRLHCQKSSAGPETGTIGFAG